MAGSTYRRVLIKLSGEGLAGKDGFGINPKVIGTIAQQIREVYDTGVQVSIVIGGGNIIRGVTAAEEGMDRNNADYMGMLASVINAMALQDSLEKIELQTRVLSAIDIAQVAEHYIRRRAIRHLEKGRVVIFAAGTGNPFFTTDTAAALRAMEIGAAVLLKGTKVRGVYDSDPAHNKNARLYKTLRYTDALQADLKVMDATAFALCRDNDLPIIVFDMNKPGNIRAVVSGEDVGTSIVLDSEETRFVEA